MFQYVERGLTPHTEATLATSDAGHDWNWREYGVYTQIPHPPVSASYIGSQLTGSSSLSPQKVI